MMVLKVLCHDLSGDVVCVHCQPAIRNIAMLVFRQAWKILASTYATSSRGRIKQVKATFKALTKGSLSISDFIHSVKAQADELAMLGAPIDGEDITDKILKELGDEYKELVRAVQARDTSITFDELHEKLLMFEASLNSPPKVSSQFTPTANAAFNRPGYRSQNHFGRYTPPPSQQWTAPSHNSSRQQGHLHNQAPHYSPRPGPHPYLGYCQVCGLQGHTAKRCPSFKFIPQKAVSSNGSTSITSWQPQ
ncbi:hypothetical protein POTOM_018804 [Populus tomentosa]|uniref:CCHC-type domain-containing protein n=1 Tax=Populus tomentosa TaxID=118781 RepID=A0A8X8CTN6_POPTO|nr:hypothetical protein POTOM_018804 [Populus tomentosa]